MDTAWSHYGSGHWWVMAILIVLYGVFLAFLPFYHVERKTLGF